MNITTPYIDGPAVATALGISAYAIKALPELCRRGRLPRPTSLGPVPTHPEGWKFAPHAIMEAIRENGPAIAAEAEEIAAEIKLGGSHMASAQI